MEKISDSDIVDVATSLKEISQLLIPRIHSDEPLTQQETETLVTVLTQFPITFDYFQATSSQKFDELDESMKQASEREEGWAVLGNQFNSYRSIMNEKISSMEAFIDEYESVIREQTQKLEELKQREEKLLESKNLVVNLANRISRHAHQKQVIQSIKQNIEQEDSDIQERIRILNEK
eukprot:TRINITY_DN8225_c0_g1_i1.p1 TRINITY_DN8225_c0_g1~~TRINITY_DN8225_c0_g1_i1.p1  ORF type:complete len:178 (+),score=55.62 TRINITY_DN8225_c0_g1_i1:22-555(+)